MRYIKAMMLSGGASGTMSIDPDRRSVGKVIGFRPSEMKVEAWLMSLDCREKEEKTDVVIYDIKVGRNSQLCSASAFSSSLLQRMNLRVEQRIDTQLVSITVFNPHNRAVSVEFSFDDEERMTLPLGLFFEPRDTRAGITGGVIKDGSIEPGDEGKFVAWSQVGGTIEKLVINDEFNCSNVLYVGIERYVAESNTFAKEVTCQVSHEIDGEIYYKDTSINPGDRLVVHFATSPEHKVAKPYHLAFVLNEKKPQIELL